MSDGVSVVRVGIDFISSFYSENKAVLSFLGGAIAFGFPHLYKIFKFFADRNDLKDKLYEELIEEAHESRRIIQNASNVLAEMKLKAQSGLFYGDKSPVLGYLTMAERSVMKPAVESVEEFYTAVTQAESLSLKKLKSYRVRARKIKHANELALAGLQARLREYGVGAKFAANVELL